MLSGVAVGLLLWGRSNFALVLLAWLGWLVWSWRRGRVGLPWAVAASLPFAPEIVLPVLDYCIHDIKLTESNRYGFKASFNPTYPAGPDNPHGWESPWHFGLNEGPTILMIENYRTELLWRLMRNCPYIVGGLRRAGFTRGWLQA